MADPVSLHKPIEILEPRPWEITLQQLRALMKNVVQNHDRIRDRIMELKERYYDGQMGDGATNWERWAINHFAYSASYLRFLSSKHPLQIDKWEAQRERAAWRLQKKAVAEDKKRAQAGWDEYKEEQRQEDEGRQKKEAKRLEKNAKQRLRDIAAKKVAVSHHQDVIDRIVEEYQSLPRADQEIVLGLIGAQPLRRAKR